MITNDFPSEVRYEEVAPPIYRNHCTPVSTGISHRFLLPLSSKRSTDRYAKILIIVAILLALSCVLLAIFTALLFAKLERVRGDLSDYSNTIADRKICFLCAQLNVSQFDPDGKAALKLLDVTLDDNGNDVCCASDARQTKSLFELVYKKQPKTTCLKGTANPETPCDSSLPSPTTTGMSAAHLIAGLQSMGNDADTAHIRNWRTDDVTTYLEGLQLIKDRLVIKDTGLYLVYSQIYFSKNVAATALRSAVLLKHSVYRYNVIYPNSGNQALMDSHGTMIFDPVTAHSALTSFTAAALHLVVGDQIYVTVSNMSLVSGDEKASFLGVVKFE
ncbi:tumor necrosis factor ligand superfamily member 10-like [Mizuhopecten yessoensis]|uniref:Tumor necrosis factor ligand superfamily member 6 n=1 Tax=Mizuhopecten yessoensis TaxID=6573 RepID=A0A210PVS0_MIZYE|nr:tumor necrosis factor ligand superfamily member 10-like [Mizuhopecten yessoensis]XP_021374085.1 tumor necrosis factor ligand superfamily member 10-like [Mizuhopecten yessoensis]OWF40555.1 Tumor necrosis factor ligand superfamily member 6 [Mizuhopecten yessoensis]